MEVQNFDRACWDDELTAKERNFVLFYCTNDLCFLNGTKSYQKAYKKFDKNKGEFNEPSEEVAAACSSRMLRKAKVKQAIGMLLKQTQQEIDETNTYRILFMLNLLATYNPADILTSDGQFVKDIKDLGPLAFCVKSIERQYNKNGDCVGVKVNLADRDKYINMLTKYLSLVREVTEDTRDIPLLMGASKLSIADFNSDNSKSENV
jgi:phage terminase small subunit